MFSMNIDLPNAEAKAELKARTDKPDTSAQGIPVDLAKLVGEQLDRLPDDAGIKLSIEGRLIPEAVGGVGEISFFVSLIYDTDAPEKAAEAAEALADEWDESKRDPEGEAAEG